MAYDEQTTGADRQCGFSTVLERCAREQIPIAIKINSETGIEELRQLIDRRDGPVFGHVLIAPDMPPVQMAIRIGKIGMAQFREALLDHDALEE